MPEYITTAHHVEHADGKRGPCYVLIGADAIVALSIRDAQRMQADGTPYRRPEMPNDAIGDLLALRPDATYFPPDFPVIAGDTRFGMVWRFTPDAA